MGRTRKTSPYDNKMKITASLLVLIALTTQSLHANVTITSPTGGNNLSADKALNSTNGAAFTALGNIVITEGATTDFAAGNGKTLILTAPSGWQFKPGTGTVTFTGSRDITAATILVTSAAATITYSVAGTSKVDVMTIGSLQVQAIDGANTPDGYIRQVYENAGSGTIAGVDIDYTTFGLLNQVAGSARGLAFQAKPGTNSSVGNLFSPQPVVQVVDQFGKLRNLDNSTIVTASRASGSGTLLGGLTRTAVFGVATYTNLSMNVAGTVTLQFSASNCAPAISDPIVITPAPADHLVFTTQPGSGAAGAPLGVQPVITAVDVLGNPTTQGLPNHQDVTVALRLANGILLGTTTLDIGTSAGNGVIVFHDLEIDALGTNYQLVASSTGFVNSTSTVFSVSAGPFVGLQLLLPGETAAPGTPTGKVGTPNEQLAGTAFNVTVNAVDVFYNVVKTVTDTVGVTSSDSNAALPANAALVSGSKVLSVTLKTAGSAIISASDISNPAKPGSISPGIAVNAAAFSKLQILLPGETAVPGSASGKVGTPAGQIAGTSFNVTINAVDANWNPIGNVSDVVGLTSSDANATLPANTPLVGGTATLSVTPLTAGNSTFTAKDVADTSKTANTSPAIAVAAGPFAQLQVLVPGENAAPGTATGKTGLPQQAMTGEPFFVIVNAVDIYWNKASSVSDVISLSSSDAAAVLPVSAALVSGKQTFSVKLNTVGSATITATDATDGSQAPVTSSTIPVALPLYTAATGGSAISADTTGGTYTALTGPVYTELAGGNVGLGTIILKAPSGFVFSTATPLPTVLINGPGGKTGNINGLANGSVAAMTSVTTTQMVFTVTKQSTSTNACKLTWQNVKVRPTAGTPLASGKLSFAGTASLVSVSTNSNLGLLQEVPGAANKFAIQTQPSATATAGVPFAQQPVLQILDKFGNFRTNDSATVVTVSRSAGSGVLQGTTARTASAGLVSFTDLAHNVATNITILFTATGVSNITSAPISVSANAATTLAFAVSPGNATAGAVFGTQPVVVTVDDFGNFSTNALAKNLNVNVAMNAGTGPLQGTVTADIGTAAGNGRLTFSDLRIDTAGSAQQLKVTASGLATGNSALFAVNAGAASQLVIGTQPSSIAQAGAAFSQQPAILVQDAFGNLRTADNTTVVTVARNSGTGVLLGTKTATASGGIARFTNLSYTNMEVIDLSFSSGALPVVISSSIDVGPGPARKIVILSQPSGTATAGLAFTQQPQVRLLDQYGNACVRDNSTVVTAARNAGTGTLKGTTAVPVSAGVATFTDLNYPIAETMNIAFSAPGATNTVSSNIVVSAGAFTKLLLLAPGETAAPGTANGKTGIAVNQAPSTSFNVTVRAADDNWNLVNSATDVISFSSSDIMAVMPTNAALVAGTKQFSVKMSECGTTNTITASDLTDGSKAPSTSAVGVTGRFISAIGGKAILASTAGGAYTSLIGPVYSESASAQVGVGTIILNPPAGFQFDTAAPVPTVKIDTLTTGSKGSNINGVTNGTVSAMATVSSTQLVFTVTKASSGNTCKLTWQNVRVRPTASSPLAVSKITKNGTSVMSGVTNASSNFGTLQEIADPITPAQVSPFITASVSQNGSVAVTAPEPASLTGNNGNHYAYGHHKTSNITPVTIISIAAVNGGMTLTVNGSPNQAYQIERAHDILGGWANIGSATTDASGQGQFTDSNAPADHGFYRTVTTSTGKSSGDSDEKGQKH